jgi:hypothetical protein
MIQVTISVSAEDTSAWARRPGSSWPCSTLAGHEITAAFVNGDLVELDCVDEPGIEIPTEEFNAFVEDTLAEVAHFDILN